jgi:quercetin dioxygenase-like cupin family protein
LLIDNEFLYGKLKGVIYDFKEVGDVLNRHAHDADTVHISIIAKGSFKVSGDGWEYTLNSGALLDWEPGVYHEFEALEPDSRLYNILKNYTPRQVLGNTVE